MDLFFSMKVFCQIVDCGSLASAARSLGLNPATVTQALAALEKRLDTRLLNRTTRRIAITEAGATYYSYARHIINESIKAEEAVRRAMDELAGPLRITLPLGAAQVFIYPHLGAFARCYPHIELDLQVNDNVVDLVEHNLDLGVRVGQLADTVSVARPLLRYRRLTCASPIYLQQHGRPQHPGELGRHACLQYRNGLGAVYWDFAVNGTIESFRIAGALASNESNALLSWARAGQGITRQPDWLVADDLKNGSLVTLLDEYVVADMARLPGIYAVLPRREHQSAKVSAFIEFFAARMQPSGVG